MSKTATNYAPKTNDIRINTELEGVIVDKKLIDIFFRDMGLSSLSQIKDNLIGIIQCAENTEEMYHRLETQIYLNVICDKIANMNEVPQVLHEY